MDNDIFHYIHDGDLKDIERLVAKDKAVINARDKIGRTSLMEYTIANNPELEEMADSEDFTVYFDVSENENGEIVVLYRSYTGALTRYYIDPSSGDVYVTEQVPGIIDEEQRTDES